MTRQKLFEYAVLYHPKPTKDQREADETPKSVVLVTPQTVIAFDDKEVGMIASRAIPDDYADKLDLVEVVIRPF